MPELWPWRSFQVSRRYLARVQARGVRGDIAKSLAELIKNCDDTYYRMEQTGLHPSGRIWVGYWKKNDKKREVVQGFFVKDEGMGMNENGLQQWEKMGESELGINSAIGEGGKDALLDYEDCRLFTIRDGKPLIVLARTDPEVGDIQTTGLAGIECTKFIEEFNERLRNSRVPLLDLGRSGTTVDFKLPTDRQIPMQRFSAVVQRLSRYYTLRKILSRKYREVVLTDAATGESIILKYDPPSGNLVHSGEFTIPHKGKNFQVFITVFKADTDLSKLTDDGENLLFVIDPSLGPVLDNTMLGFEARPGARRLFGEVVIPEWRMLYEMEKGTVITDSRDGLDPKNQFNIKLHLKVYAILAKLIDEEERHDQATVELDETFHKALKEAFSLINEQIKREAEPGVPGGSISELPPDWFEFVPRETSVVLGTKRKVKLRLNPERIPPSSEIKLEADNDAVKIEPYPIVTTPRAYDTRIPECEFVLEGITVGGMTTFTASLGEVKAILQVTVIEKQEIIAPIGLLLKPRISTYRPGGVGRLKLYVDTTKVPKGTKVSVESFNSAISLGVSAITTCDPNITESIFEEVISVRGGKEGDRSDVKASVKDSDIEVWASVKVVRPETPESYFNDVQLDNKTPVGRYHFDKYEEGQFTGKGVVWVHTRNPVLSEYFGPGLSHLNQVQRIEAKILLADTVVQCVREVWARYKLIKGIESSRNPESFDEIKRISDKIDAEWGPIFYKKMLGQTRHRKRVKKKVMPEQDKDIEGMRKMLSNGSSVEQVAKSYQVTPYHVWKVAGKHRH